MTKLLSPLFTVFIFAIGNGLLSTLLVVRLSETGASTSIIGALTSAYFAGFALGSFRLGKLVVRVGHIRAYSGFAAGIIAIIILHGLFIIPWLWIILRFISGFLVGGILLVIESWLMSQGQREIRGQILAAYMILLYFGLGLGQLVLEAGSPKTLELFSMSAMFFALSIIPLAISKSGQPQIEAPVILSWPELFKITKTALFGAFSAGLILSNIYGLMPVFFLGKTNSSVHDVAIFMSVVILGGVFLQYPIGRLSDKLNRPLLILLCCLLIFVLSVLIITLFDNTWIAMSSIFIFGGITFTLYPISISHACDKLESKYIIAGSQSLLLGYSTGATLGPIIAPLFIRAIGVNGLFLYFIVIAAAFGLFLLYILLQKKTKLPEEPYVSVPGTTPIVSKLDPRGRNKDKNG